MFKICDFYGLTSCGVKMLLTAILKPPLKWWFLRVKHNKETKIAQLKGLRITRDNLDKFNTLETMKHFPVYSLISLNFQVRWENYARVSYEQPLCL